MNTNVFLCILHELMSSYIKKWLFMLSLETPSIELIYESVIVFLPLLILLVVWVFKASFTRRTGLV